MSVKLREDDMAAKKEDTLRVSRVPMFTDRQEADAKLTAKPAEMTKAMRLKMVRDEIIRATVEFANQPVLVSAPESFTPDELKIVAALGKLHSASSSVGLPMRDILAVLTGKTYPIAGVEDKVKYNMLAAFVPLDRANSHTYALGKVSVCVNRNLDGIKSFDPTNSRLGDTPPSTLKVGSVTQIRPASTAEIMAIPDAAIEQLVTLSGIVFLYPPAEAAAES